MAVIKIRTETAGNIWKILVKPGDLVAAGDILIVLESMKMEIPINAPKAGSVTEIFVTENMSVAENDVVATIEPT